jgi:uncharacterized protein (TIGR00266 family)
MKSHEVDYRLLGDDLQIVEVELDPGETVIAEAGAMNYMDGDIQFETKMGDGSNPASGFLENLLSVGKRVLTSESIFMTHFTNRGHRKQKVAFAAAYPGKIVPMDLASLGGTLLCQKDAFLCAALGTELSIAFTQKLGAGFFGGEGFILQQLRGDGWAFVHAGGTVIEKKLAGQTLRVDTGASSLSPGHQIQYPAFRQFEVHALGGEGLFLATLQGMGTVWLQSLPFSRLADRIIRSAPVAGGGESVEQSSFLSGILNSKG